MSVAWEIVQGDTEPPYAATLKVNGAVVPLASAVEVRFVMEAITEPKVVSALADVLDADAGRVSYQWEDGDTDVPDLYRQHWRILWAGNHTQTIPNEGYDSIRVWPDIG